jgi:myosin heavy subunit
MAKADSATRFAVAHFAGDVTYESRHFVETNAQAVRQEIITFLMAATTSPFLR